MSWRHARNMQLDPEEQARIAALYNDGYTGKWLVFVPEAQVAATWQTIFTATESGELGWAAKVSTRSTTTERVTCVYTRDYRDHADVIRVLTGLRDLGFTKRLTYKEDAATEALHYRGHNRRPAALYIAVPGDSSIRRVRSPFTTEDSKFEPLPPVTAEQLFSIDRDNYGLLPG